jgi:hypothetical protein
VSKKKPKTIDASCPVTLMGCEGEVIVEMTPTEAVSMIEKAWQENRRLRQENATLAAERDEARRSLCRVESSCRTVTVEEWSRNNADGITKWVPIEPERVAAERGWSCFKKDCK